MSQFTLYPGAMARVRRELLGPVADGAVRIVRNEIIETMDPGPPRTGRVYTVPGTGTPYVASAPGEPPAIRTGVYRDGWEVTPAIEVGDAVVASALNAVRDEGGELLGEKLEFGGGNPPIAPRPHVRPAIAKAEPKIRAWVRKFER